MNEERIVFMQTEDRQVTFERENGDTIIYALALVPSQYKEGDIIRAIVHDENFIEFLDLDVDEMNRRRECNRLRRERLGKRVRRA